MSTENKKIEKVLGEKLIQRGTLTKEQWADIIKEKALSHESIISLLVSRGGTQEKDVLQTVAEAFNLQYVNLKRTNVQEGVVEKVPSRIAFYYTFMPLQLENRVLTIAVSLPLDIKTQDELRTHLGYDIEMVIAHQDDILETLKKTYGVGADTLEKISSASIKAGTRVKIKEEKIEDIEKLEEDASVTKLVNEIIFEAYKKRATDIHLEPSRDDVTIRYRIDGVLYDINVSKEIRHFLTSIISRIKIMCNLNIVEKRLPQDGRAIVKTHDQTLDLRVSTLPTPYGESVVIRLLPTKMLFSLERLGLSKDDLDTLERLIQNPYGIMFVTGPTGSGKTTTLYACLSRINTRDRKIITLEDPIEYEIKGITQIQVQPEIGLDFSRGLRSILRHDPDIIMIGEVRDLETAEIAIRVALTGHLIFSTLHTNDAASGITRLIDIGIEPYLISSSVEAFIAQRLVRVLCPHCKYEDTEPLGELRRNIANDLKLDSEEDVKIFKAQGCDECNATGFLGRTAIYEILLIDEDVKELILKRVPSGEIKRLAISKNMRTLIQDGWRKVIEGITTPEEVLRVVSTEEHAASDTRSVFSQDTFTPSTERRVYARLDSCVNVHYKVIKSKEEVPQYAAEFEKFSMSQNISASGIAFNIQENLAVDTMLDLQIDLPDAGEAIRCLGKVVWIREIPSGAYQVGVSFLVLRGAERNRLNQYVTKQW